MMKILKEQNPQNQANQRVENEIATFEDANVQNAVYMNALELQNIYSNYIIGHGKNAINEMAKNKSMQFVEKTQIIRGKTSSPSVNQRDVDLEKQTSDIHDWIKSKHSQSRNILVEFTKHATAYVRVSANLKLFFDPNFGIVRFTSISRIAKFFEGLFKIPEVRSSYMRNDETIDLRAYR